MKRRSGFTVVEVMVSLGVMTVGAMAIMAMQQQTTRANVHARELTTATAIAQTWIERLKIDAVRWNATSNQQSDLAGTTYLSRIWVTNGKGVFTGIPQQPGLLNAPGALNSNAFDYYGNELDWRQPTTQGRVVYCAGYRLSWIYPGRVLRTDVRVWWSREGSGATIETEFQNCADNPAVLTLAGLPNPKYHVVYLSTSIRNLQYR